MLAAVVFATSLPPRIAGLWFEATPRVNHMQQHTEVGPNASVSAHAMQLLAPAMK
jgi:hypothetical protein